MSLDGRVAALAALGFEPAALPLYAYAKETVGLA
jgi:hypothetical protein